MSRPSHAEPPPGLDIVRRVVDGTVVVSVAGEVDMETAPALRAAVTTAVDDAAGGACVLDLTGVTFLGSPGLTALLAATTHAQARRGPLRIVVDTNRPVIRPIEITRLDDVLWLYHTVEEALTAEHRPPGDATESGT
ncbi:STAS domain-containing protein [Saccharothrix deserti]|uniref:STAS domain-containing protein n=1 Tax=Saccharothrix deserti TaxID=2593674 RepID=UPI00131DF210|nr:STAS domain-containing protein [Saccharothrix deserti]